MRKTLDAIRDACDTEGECWIWRNGINSAGYPQATFEGERRGGHMVRQAVMQLLGRDRPGKAFVVSARCRHKRCCAPGCLRWTHRAAVQHQSWALGQRSKVHESVRSIKLARSRGNALSLEQAEQIRILAGQGHTTIEIGRRVGLPAKRITDIRLARNHIPFDPIAAIVRALR